ncbi:MAG: primosomal protein [Nanoarchaeota archaeon]|nr:primosomal protein [Nanoarchaeota archaeon]
MSQKVLLREYFSLCPDGSCRVDLLTEQEKKLKNDGKIILSGILQRANAKNGNKRVYAREILQREDRNYQKLINENRALGECDHPDSEIVNLKNASHVIKRTFWDGDDLYGIIQVLSTPSGKILEALVNDGVMLGISSRGLGSVTESKNGTMVNDDFILVAYDIVSDPSTEGAFMRLNESKLREKDVLTRADRIYRSLNTILEKK